MRDKDARHGSGVERFGFGRLSVVVARPVTATNGQSFDAWDVLVQETRALFSD